LIRQTFPVGGNRRKPTTFGKALTDSSHDSVVSIEPTNSELKDACYVTTAPPKPLKLVSLGEHSEGVIYK
jgi:hypothetical protein